MTSPMYSIYEELLKKRGVTTADVSRATGINQSTFANWKRRQNELSMKNAALVAEFFGVTVDTLRGAGEQSLVHPGVYTSEQEEVIRLFSDRPEIEAFIDEARDAAPEDVKTALEVLRSLKRRRK